MKKPNKKDKQETRQEKKQKLIIIGALSLTLIGLELAWTRIFSAEYFYTFAFLIISLAILGLGVGSLTLRLFEKIGKKKPTFYLNLTGLAAIVTPPLVFALGLDFAHLFSITMILKLLAGIALLSLPYYFGGIVLGMLFKREPGEIPMLYMSDLAGAACGVILGIVLMNMAGTPAATFLISIPVLAAAVYASDGKPRLAAGGLIALALVMSVYGKNFLKIEHDEKYPVIYESWDAMSKIKILEYNPMYRGIVIDNHASMPVVGFDGNYNIPDSLKKGIFEINVGYLIRQFKGCRFLALGAGGGRDALHALLEGAGKVYAVEVNPLINYLMTEGNLASFSGYIYRDPRVEVVTEDARTYIRSYKNKFDVIFSFSSNSYASLASGAFALAENYIYTVEAFEDYWKALSDDGYLVIEHHVYVPRMLGEAIEALKNLGVDDIKSHLAVYNLPEWNRKVILLSKRNLTQEIRDNAIGELSPANHNIHLLYPPSPGTDDGLENRIINAGWQAAAGESKYDITPSTDDSPYTPQMGLWKNFSFSKLSNTDPFGEFLGFPLAKVIIMTILIFITILIFPLLLLPYFRKGAKPGLKLWLYFFAIGMGYMMIEVILIQKYTFFIGASVWSIGAVLLTLLGASGLGSMFSGKVDRRIVFFGILIWLLADVFLFRGIFYSLGSMGLTVRILVTMVLISPAGFLMGMPFPKGALRAGELIDWCFAINGAASVFGATVAVLLAFSFGFGVTLLVAGAFYIFAFYLSKDKIIV